MPAIQWQQQQEQLTGRAGSPTSLTGRFEGTSKLWRNHSEVAEKGDTGDITPLDATDIWSSSAIHDSGSSCSYPTVSACSPSRPSAAGPRACRASSSTSADVSLPANRPSPSPLVDVSLSSTVSAWLPLTLLKSLPLYKVAVTFGVRASPSRTYPAKILAPELGPGSPAKRILSYSPAMPASGPLSRDW